MAVGAEHVGTDHEGPPVPVIRRQTGGDGQQCNRRGTGEGDNARLDGRVGQRKDEERIGDDGGLGARTRQELTSLEQDELAIAPERDGGHARDAIGRVALLVAKPGTRASPSVVSAQTRWMLTNSSTATGACPLALVLATTPLPFPLPLLLVVVDPFSGSCSTTWLRPDRFATNSASSARRGRR